MRVGLEWDEVRQEWSESGAGLKWRETGVGWSGTGVGWNEAGVGWSGAGVEWSEAGVGWSGAGVGWSGTGGGWSEAGVEMQIKVFVGLWFFSQKKKIAFFMFVFLFEKVRVGIFINK